MGMLTAICDDCGEGCDGMRMEYLVEVTTDLGKEISIAPINNGYLDKREMIVREIPAHISEVQLATAPVKLVCEKCTAARLIVRCNETPPESADALPEVHSDWFNMQIIAKNEDGKPSMAIRTLPVGSQQAHLPLSKWELPEGSFLQGTDFTTVFFQVTRDNSYWFSSKGNKFGFFVKVEAVQGAVPDAILIECGIIRSAPQSVN